jgi:CelD/BcsL family acetyltransferase involved in cellulose biosynthesis
VNNLPRSNEMRITTQQNHSSVSEFSAHSALDTLVLTSDDELSGLEADWIALLRRMNCQSPFLSFDWLTTWWRHFGAGKHLFVVTVRNSRAQLVGLAPLCLGGGWTSLWGFRKLGFLGTGPSDRLDLLVDPRYLRPAVRAMAASLFERRREWDYVELSECDEASAALGELRCTLKELGLAERVALGSVCPYVVLPESFNEYLQGIGPNLRRNFRRRLRALQRLGKVEFVELHSPNDVRVGFEDLVGLHRLRFSQKGEASGFLGQELPFHRDILHTGLGQEKARVFLLRVDGRSVGAWYGFSMGSVFFSYQSGMDPDWSHLSVGLVTLGSTIESAISRKHSEVDFLRGDEDYKFQWTNRSRRNFNVLLFSARPRSQAARVQATVHAGARSLVRRARRVAKGALRYVQSWSGFFGQVDK